MTIPGYLVKTALKSCNGHSSLRCAALPAHDKNECTPKYINKTEPVGEFHCPVLDDFCLHLLSLVHTASLTQLAVGKQCIQVKSKLCLSKRTEEATWPPVVPML